VLSLLVVWLLVFRQSFGNCHLSFDLLSRLSGLRLVRGLPKLKYQKDLVCAPCRHSKMVAASHPPLTSVMTERPCELFHMDLVGPARVCSAAGKWYVLVIVDDYSRYAWVFFLADKGETFGFVRDLILRLKNERHGDAIRAIRSDNGSEFKTLISKPFVVIWVSNISFLLPMWLVRMVWLRVRIVPFVRWLR
jgi:hypothetical protein